MITRKIFAAIGKRVYHNDYTFLHRRLLEEYSRLNIPVELKEELRRFLISGEDHRFRFHCGFDVIAILRAIKNRLLYNRLEGASTIEQQLVRVLSGHYEKTFSRKIKEILLATTLSEIIPRREIPHVYLNIAYYGTEMIGLNQALMKLSHIDDVKTLASELVARIKYPEPRKITLKREGQIKKRKIHLDLLYARHNKPNKIVSVYG